MAKRLRFTRLLAATFLVGTVLAIAGTSWALSTASASSGGSLTCAVKPSCSTDEVAVFRTSSTANAHAGTSGGSSYANVVCCTGVDGLGASCGGNHKAVLTLSAADNAHAASDGSYPTEVCLSVGVGQAVNCTYGASCGAGWSCLATISGSSNAHVADCDGSNDYATKVCCGTSLTGPVGGIAELPEEGESGSSTVKHVILASALAAAAVAVTVMAWYTRRRWLQ